MTRWGRRRRRRRIERVLAAVIEFGSRPPAQGEQSARELGADDGSLTPTEIAGHLREIAEWMHQAAEKTARRARAIEAKYGRHFRTATLIYGEAYTPYLDYLAAPRKIATAGAARRDALALAAAYDRLARKPPRGRKPDLALCYEHQDTARLLAALDDAGTRVQAVRFLGRLQATAAVDPLLGLLDDPVAAEEAVRALGRIGDARALDPLIAFVRRDPDLKEASAAVVALGELGDPRAVGFLLGLLPRNSLIGNLAAYSLAKIGDPRAVPPMREALARRQSEPAESDVSKRLRDLDCRRIEEAIDTLTGKRDSQAG
ncbi:HEAT repeat domain-containing protein [Amycolatopsis sp. NBC_01480]|uniref:HEAT repeat domain-containing protein n=1 Tax=Amycolatopsis sp. NBC_01480 TaxID=2903562 RepID=UPI002E2B30A7|nr:HEAT repeat domain-containing protein [Amycolatopsis sp. NBC_01480]